MFYDLMFFVEYGSCVVFSRCSLGVVCSSLVMVILEPRVSRCFWVSALSSLVSCSLLCLHCMTKAPHLQQPKCPQPCGVWRCRWYGNNEKSGAHIVANDIYPVVEDGAVVVHLVETKAVSRQGGTSIKDGKNPLLASPITLPLHIVVYRHPAPL